MALQNSAINPMQLFLAQTYHIPNYQREYSWEEEELEDFWNDLIATKSEPNESHFFGQIVVHNDVASKKKYIIDGQQRTTTSMVFLRTLQVYFAEIFESSKNKQADYRRTDIETKYLGREDERHLILGEMDHEYFEKFILSSVPNMEGKAKKKSNERLRRAYNFFTSKIQGLMAEDFDDEDKYDALKELYDTFAERFMVLYMEATELEEAFVIFETLNARGKDLETADLLKNYILNQSKDINTSLKKWNLMVNKLDKCDPTKYIRTFWNATQSFSREKALYREINRKINTPKTTKDLLNDLENLSMFYHDMVLPAENTVYETKDLVNSFRALKMLKASTFYPVVLAMKMKKAFTEKDITDVVKVIECYVFRNFTICGNTANSAEVYFAGIAKAIFDEELLTVDDICSRISKGIVDDGEFKDSFIRWSGSKSAKETVRYILRKIHSYLDKSNELNLDNSDVHIEHIMPEDASKWDVPSNVHEACLWKLGNLCLLSAPLNQGASNAPFEVKETYYADSKIEPNRDIKKYLEDGQWGPGSISMRQQYFSELALQIWKK